MSKILQLDMYRKDLWLSYTWSNLSHGVCGHLYEIIDYYFLLRDKYKIGLLICEPLSWESVRAAILDKYEVTPSELNEIKSDLVFADRPSVVKGKNILFTNGGVTSLQGVSLLFDKIIHFACGDFSIKLNTKPNVYILQDDRIYEKCFNSINYIKKINFARYHKKINSEQEKFDYLIYATKSCRDLTPDQYREIENNYSGNFLCLSNEGNVPKDLSAKFTVEVVPVSNLFSRFNTYIYTPIERKFDCSSRLLAECRFYQKKVEFFKIDYWDVDKGLYWRNFDVNNNFESLFLNLEDEIFGILDRIL